ncbi:MAG: TonB-dependent receptor [Bacteroidetes bacterium]|nr:TonB-dependent receptor [Bacteroidota bacterium]
MVLSFIGQDLLAQSWLSVLDENGHPMTGVCARMNTEPFSILAVSDDKGLLKFTESESYRFPLPLRLEYLGMEPLELTLEKKSGLEVTMRLDRTTLSQVLITGEYGVSRPERSVNRVDIITAEEIQNSGAADIADILQHKADIRIQQDGVIGTGVSIQGLGDRNVKILINEVPVVGRVDGKLDLSQLDITDIERIEVVKGPMAAIYGTDAIAGVINIITKKPTQSQTSALVRGYYSSEGQYDTQFRVDGTEGSYYYALRGARRFFDGWSSGDPTFSEPTPLADERRSRQWNMKEQYQAGLSQAWQSEKVRIGHRLDYLTDEITDRGLPFYTFDQALAIDQSYHTTRLDNTLDFQHGKVDGPSFKGFIAYNHFRRIRDEFVTDLTDLSQFQNETQAADTTFYNAIMGRYTMAVNATEKFSYQMGMDGSMENSRGDRIAGEPEMQKVEGFANAEWRPVDGFNVKPSIRYGYNSLYKVAPTPSLALRYQKDLYTFRLSYGRGFRAPDFKELFLAFFDSNHNVFGNEELTAEQSDNYAFSVSFAQSLAQSQWKWEVALFHNDLRDKIELVQAGSAQSGPQPFTYLNVDEVRTQGARVDVEYGRKVFRTRAGAGLIGLEEVNDGLTVIPINYYPQWNASISYEEPLTELDIELYASGVGSREFLIREDEETRSFRQEAFSMLDLSAGRSFLDSRLDLRIGARNLLGVETLNAIGTGSHSGSSTSSLLATGRTFFITCTFHINKSHG